MLEKPGYTMGMGSIRFLKSSLYTFLICYLYVWGRVVEISIAALSPKADKIKGI